MPKRWSEVIASPEYQKLSATDKADAQAQYFDSVVKPQLQPDEIDDAHNQFYSQYPVGTTPSEPEQPQPEPKETTFLDDVEEAGKGALRIAGGAVADVANIGVGAVNAVKSAGAWAGKELGLGDGTYTPMQEASYGEALNPYLMPATTGEKIVASIPSYMVGGEVAAPVKAAEGAGLLARAGTSILNQLPQAVTGTLSQDNQSPDDMAADLAVNAILPAAVEKAAKPIVSGARRLLPEFLGGTSRAETAANRFGDDASLIYQGGDATRQGVVKDIYTANDRSGVADAIDNATGSSPKRAQDVIRDATAETRAQTQAEYTQNIGQAQEALDAKKVTELHMKNTKQTVQDHLAENENSDILESKTKRVLSKLKDRKFNNLSDVNQVKQDLNNLKSWAYTNQHFKDYEVLSDVVSKLKGEADATVKHFAPDAMPAWEKADELHSSLAGDWGKKSKAGKLSANDNQELVENQLMGNSATARFNTQQTVDAMERLRNNPNFTGGDVLASDYSAAMGNTARQRAHELATKAAYEAESVRPGTGDATYYKKFNDLLSKSQAQMSIVDSLSNTSQQAINQSAIDAVNLANRGYQPGTVATAAKKALDRVPLVGGLSEMATDRIGNLFHGMSESSKRKFLQNATPEEIEQMYQYSIGNTINSDVAGTVGKVTAPTYTGLQVSESNRPVETPEAYDVPQYAQTAKKQTEDVQEFEPKVTKLYKALAHAETGGLKNRFIRTKAAESGVSTAYGPAQITVSLMDDFYSRNKSIFNAKERDYIKRFSEQGHLMKKADSKDPVFGYGGVGTLGSAEDRKLYAAVARKMLQKMIKDNGGSLDKTMHQWRGNDKDTNYFKKVSHYYHS